MQNLYNENYTILLREFKGHLKSKEIHHICQLQDTVKVSILSKLTYLCNSSQNPSRPFKEWELMKKMNCSALSNRNLLFFFKKKISKKPMKMTTDNASCFPWDNRWGLCQTEEHTYLRRVIPTDLVLLDVWKW